MNNDLKEGKEIRSGNRLRRIYDDYAAGVAYISVIDKHGDYHTGTGFHIGEGVFITARHVVENCKVVEIGTTVSQSKKFETPETSVNGSVASRIFYTPQSTRDFKGPFLHPDKKIDVAAIIAPDIQAPILPLGSNLDDWFGDDFILTETVVMGYPPIPFTDGPLLIVSKSEVNAVVDKYTGGHPQFILSSMARGGFSGGPVFVEYGFVLGLITESLVQNGNPAELGYFSALSVEPIFTCIAHHKIIPDQIDKDWNGFWNTESTMFSASPSDHISVSIYRGKVNRYFEVFSFRLDVIMDSLEVIDKYAEDFYSLYWLHEKMIKVEFRNNKIDDTKGDAIYAAILTLIENKGISRFPNTDDNEEKPF